MGIPSLATFAKKKKKKTAREQKRKKKSRFFLCPRTVGFNQLKVMTEKPEPGANKDYITSMNMSPHNRMRHLSVVSKQQRHQQQPLFVSPLRQNGPQVNE